MDFDAAIAELVRRGVAHPGMIKVRRPARRRRDKGLLSLSCKENNRGSSITGPARQRLSTIG
jgi:hypothetical protein